MFFFTVQIKKSAIFLFPVYLAPITALKSDDLYSQRPKNCWPFISYRHHSYPLRHSSRLFIHCSNKHSRKIFRLSL